MYAGRIVESGTRAADRADPHHPYTIGLLRSRADGALAKARASTPSREARPTSRTGRRAVPSRRAASSQRSGAAERSPLSRAAGAGHQAACWRSGEAAESFRRGRAEAREPVLSD